MYNKVEIKTSHMSLLYPKNNMKGRSLRRRVIGDKNFVIRCRMANFLSRFGEKLHCGKMEEWHLGLSEILQSRTVGVIGSKRPR